MFPSLFPSNLADFASHFLSNFQTNFPRISPSAVSCCCSFSRAVPHAALVLLTMILPCAVSGCRQKPEEQTSRVPDNHPPFEGFASAERSVGVQTVTAPEVVQPIGRPAQLSGDVTVPSREVTAQDAPNVPLEDNSVVLELSSWEEILHAAKTAGRPVVLDVWSLSCDPCLREYPGLVKLHEDYGDRLQCISANIEFDGRKSKPPASYFTSVHRFLRAQGSTLKNLLCTTPSDDVYAALEIDSIPAVILFDAQGNEVQRFVDAGETIGFTYQTHVNPAVAKLLGPLEGAEGAAGAEPTAPGNEAPGNEAPAETPPVSSPDDGAAAAGTESESESENESENDSADDRDLPPTSSLP